MLQASTSPVLVSSRRSLKLKLPPCTCGLSSLSRAFNERQTQNQANTSAYDALFGGMVSSFGSGRAGPSGANPSSLSRQTSYGPLLGRNVVQSRQAGRRVSPKQQQLNPADHEAFKQTLDVLFSDTSSGKRKAPEISLPRTLDAEPSKGIQWKDLLDMIESKAKMRKDALQTPIQPLEQEKHLHTPLLEEIAQRQQTEERFAAALMDEVKTLEYPVQALQWMEERVFSSSNPGSLIRKLTDVTTTPSKAILDLYPNILVDLTNLLAVHSPHLAIVPLKLASTHSPHSYLYGCTSNLYAAVLKIRWQAWSDVEGCFALLEEMERGAVPQDHAILRIVSAISDAVSADVMQASQAVDQASGAKQNSDEDAPESDSLSDLLAGLTATSSPSSFWIDAPKLELSPIQQRDRERGIEARMFFSPAQRKALQKIEELVVEHRDKQRLVSRKEEAFEKLIRESASNIAGENESEVTKLANSYGQSEAVTEERVSYDHLHPLLPPHNRSAALLPRRRPLRDARGVIEVENAPDVLSAAIDEVLSQEVGQTGISTKRKQSLRKV